MHVPLVWQLRCSRLDVTTLPLPSGHQHTVPPFLSSPHDTLYSPRSHHQHTVPPFLSSPHDTPVLPQVTPGPYLACLPLSLSHLTPLPPHHLTAPLHIISSHCSGCRVLRRLFWELLQCARPVPAPPPASCTAPLPKKWLPPVVSPHTHDTPVHRVRSSAVPRGMQDVLLD